MSNKKNEQFDDELDSTNDPRADTTQAISHEVPTGVDRRSFLIRSAVVGAAAIMTGRTISAAERTFDAVKSMPPALTITRGLNVHRASKGPIMTTFDELFKVGPGPSGQKTMAVGGL